MLRRYLTHYTGSALAVGAILRDGFAYVPNPRRLIHLLVPEHDWSAGEPQQFGMISFTVAPVWRAAAVRAEFGHYGIMVLRSWAKDRGARPVVYVRTTGPQFEQLRRAFTAAFRRTRDAIPHPDDTFWTRAFTNRWFAIAQGWPEMLAAYELTEPAEHAAHREWRICHSVPLSAYAPTTTEIIRNVSPPTGWARVLNVVPVPADAVVGLVCPADEVDTLRAELPPALQGRRIRKIRKGLAV